MTYRKALQVGTDILTKAGIDNPEGDAWTLLEKACDVNRTYYFLHQDEVLKEEQKTQYRIMLTKRVEHIPLQYITGEQEFMGLNFKVNSSVLIPRLDTEILVEQVLKHIQPGMKVLDMCTGSGCIIVSLKHFCGEIEATGTDISQAALLTAKENAHNNDVKVSWVQSNLFEKIHGTFDVIVSNPPYIPTAVIEGLEDEVRCYEPTQALDGMEDGLFFYRRIVSDAKKFFNRNGMLFFEIGAEQGQAVANMMKAEAYIDIHVEKDLTTLDRVVYGIYPGET